MMKKAVAKVLRDREVKYPVLTPESIDLSQEEYELLFYLADRLYEQEKAKSGGRCIAFATLWDYNSPRFLVYTPAQKYAQELRQELEKSYRKLGLF